MILLNAMRHLEFTRGYKIHQNFLIFFLHVPRQIFSNSLIARIVMYDKLYFSYNILKL